jgi:triphosphoribosyl-dephospho-CoA synthase
VRGLQSPAEVAVAAQLACLLEVSAPKPGNVSPGRHFADARYEDFLASAAAIGGPLAGAGTRPLGATIRLAVEATASWAPSNTNLGIVLLLAPLAAAAMMPADTPVADRIPMAGPAETVRRGESSAQELRRRLRCVLAGTTVGDAREVYAAIRLASPGGLGTVPEQDVAGEPSVTLLEAMRLAADRDAIAREYATGFATTFEIGLPTLARARRDGLKWDDAVVETFLTLLAGAPDTHIARRAGLAAAVAVSERARAVLERGGVRSAEGRRALDEMDRALRGDRHLANPGASADLAAAAIFVFLVEGGWRRPVG